MSWVVSVATGLLRIFEIIILKTMNKGLGIQLSQKNYTTRPNNQDYIVIE